MSVGNDLVCLSVAAARSVRFVEKVLTPYEQQLMHNAPEPDVFLWLLWSLKEAAYKYCQRLDPARPFVPTRYTLFHLLEAPPVCSAPTRERGFDPQTTATAFVQTPGRLVVSRSVRTDTCLMSVAGGSLAETDRICWGIWPIRSALPGCQSAQVRAVAADRIRAELRLPPDSQLRFGRGGADGGNWPTLHVDDQPQPTLLSFSHDDQYVAYAFLAS